MKFRFLFIIPLLFLSFGVFAQTVAVTELTGLSANVEETSGLLYLDGKVITHNDSGNAPELYEVDSVSGAITRTIVISNATNVDWEDLCVDDTCIYIGDFGNNQGTRTNLCIYRVRIADFLSSNSIVADTLTFSYADQTDFTANANTNFDAEAFFAMGDSLYIFSKNWGNLQSKVYALPKNAKGYSCENSATIPVNGLVTSADYLASKNEVMLVGYSTLSCFAGKIQNFVGTDFSTGTLNIQPLTLNAGLSYQVEGVVWKNETQLYISAEKFTYGGIISLSSWLGRLDWEDESGIITLVDDILVYPNPATNVLYVDASEFGTVRIVSLDGRLVYSGNQNPIDISRLESGVYIIQFFNKNKQQIQLQKIQVVSW